MSRILPISLAFCLAAVGAPAFSSDVVGANWTGFYAGGQLLDGEVSNSSEKLDYTAVGAHSGYLKDFGAFVLGGEMSYTAGEIETEDGDLDADILRGKVIAGYDFGDILPYVSAGIGNVDIEDVGSKQSTFIGVGGVYELDSGWLLGAEYISDFVNNVVSDDDVIDLEIETLSLRASFSF